MPRIVDDHDFTIARPDGGGWGSCRVQIFTAPGQQPLVVATQTLPPRGGVALTNAAERFAAAVWQRYIPDSVDPPRWVEHYDRADPDEPPSWHEVSFIVGPGRSLSSPSWQGLSGQHLTELVGESVDPGRGNYNPPPAPPAPRYAFVLVPVLELPRPHPFRQPVCMPSGSGKIARSWRRLRPRTLRDCCWYHRGDWRTVIDHVASVLGPEVSRDGAVVDDDLRHDLVAELEANLGSTWPGAAAASLLLFPLVVEEGQWINGQHRGQAMIDAGCGMALLERMVRDAG